MTQRRGKRHLDLSKLDWSLILLDIVGIATLPIVLLLFQFGAPAGIRSLLTYTSTDPTLHGLFGHWAVHYSPLLLVENAVGFLLVAVLGYLLALGINERWWYRLSLLGIVLIVPVVGALVSTQAFGRISPGFSYTSRGASAVVAATLGLAYVLVLGTIRRTDDLRATISVGGSMLIAVLVILLARVGSPSVEVIAFLIGTGGLVVVLDGVERVWNGSKTSIRYPAFLETVVVAGAGTLVMTAYFIALFPPNPFEGEFVTNVFSHAIGFGLGTVIALFGHRYWTDVDWIEDFKSNN